MNTISKTLIAGAITAALVLPASGAFAGEKTNKAILGAVIGGIAGAALGDGDKGAIAIGAVAGAALGASTANNNDRRYSNGYQSRPAYSSYNNGYNNRYQASNYGRQTDTRYYGRNDRNDRYDTRYDHNYRR